MPGPENSEQQAPAQAADAPKAEQKKKSALSDADKRAITKKVYTEETSVMNPVEYEQQRKMANDFYQSGALPKTYENPEQVFMAVVLGRQMGFNPVEAIQKGYYVDGRYQVWGSAVPLALRRHGYRWKFKDESKDSVTIEVWPVDDKDDIIEDIYTFDDARLSGFTTDRNGNLKFGWKEGANRKRKLRYGALSQVINTYLPDVLSGVADIAEYSEEYIEGQVVEDEKNEAGNSQRNAIEDQVKKFKPATVTDTKPTAA